MSDDHDLDWLAEHRPCPDAPTPAATGHARAALLAHGGRLQRRRQITRGGAGGALLATVVAASIVLGSELSGPTTHPRQPAVAVVAPRSRVRHAPVPSGPLLHLAADARAMRRQPGDATLVVRHTVTHEAKVGTFTGYDLYADDGRYYFGTSPAGLRAQVAARITQTNQTSPRVLRAFAKAAGDSPAQARRAIVTTQPRAAVTRQPRRALSPSARRIAAHNRVLYARRHHGHPAPRSTFRGYLDSYLWIIAIQALQAGAGRPQVRAGAMRVLASLQHVTQTPGRLHGRAVLRVRFLLNIGGSETVWLTDGTGVPLREVDGSGPDASVTTYHVRRVSLPHLP